MDEQKKELNTHEKEKKMKKQNKQTYEQMK
jgi:hypothetical protein